MRSKYIVMAVALSVSVVSIAWSADEPATPAATPAAQPAAQAAPAAAAAASSTSTPAKAPAKEAATADAGKNSEAEAQEKHLLASGYKKKTHNGETVYCRKEMPIGSRFEKERCGTAQEMELQAQQARDLMNGNKVTPGGSK